MGAALLSHSPPHYIPSHNLVVVAVNVVGMVVVNVVGMVAVNVVGTVVIYFVWTNPKKTQHKKNSPYAHKLLKI